MPRGDRKRIAALASLITSFVLGGAAASATPPVDLTKVLPPPAPASSSLATTDEFGLTAPTATPLERAILAVLDDFNRPDGPIGSNWTVHNGSCNVSSNAAVCSGQGRATFNGASGSGDTAEMDVATNGTSLQYAALLLNYGAGITNVFLKVQQQNGSGRFEYAACYTGNNGPPFGLSFFDLSSPFSTAHMRATRVGTTVTLEFTNIDGGAQPNQTYVCNGAPPPEGTGIGIGGYAGVARMDNFAGGGGGADVSGTKTVAGTFQPGGTITYTVVLTNTGPAAQGDNPGDEFTDTLPPQLTATGATATSGTASLVGNVVSWNGALAAGGSVTITISATINASVPVDTRVSNQGTINYDGAGSGSNGSTRLTDDPAVEGSADPTVFAVLQPPEPIPVLGGGGLALLALLLGAAAVLTVRRFW